MLLHLKLLLGLLLGTAAPLVSTNLHENPGEKHEVTDLEGVTNVKSRVDVFFTEYSLHYLCSFRILQLFLQAR